MERTVNLNLLDRIRIASPCTARWEDMTGDDKIRHCADCNLKVHNFSAMSRGEAESLLSRHFDASGIGTGGRVCGGWYRRADGTAIFADCPVGWAKVRRHTRLAMARVAALCGLTSLVSLVAARSISTSEQAGQNSHASALAPFATIARWLTPAAPPPILGKMMVKGEVYIPPAPTNSATTPTTTSACE